MAFFSPAIVAALNSAFAPEEARRINQEAADARNQVSEAFRSAAEARQRAEAESEARQQAEERAVVAEAAQQVAERSATEAMQRAADESEARQGAEQRMIIAESERQAAEYEAVNARQRAEDEAESRREAEIKAAAAETAWHNVKRAVVTAEMARQIAERKAIEAQRRADNEVESRQAAERQTIEARREAKAAEEEMKKMEERCWKKGIPPGLAPTREEVDAMRARYGYIQGHRHIAVVGRSRAGKSALINAFRGMTNADCGATQVGVNGNGAAACAIRYSDPKNSKCAWYEITSKETLDVPDWQCFKDQGLYIFDAIIVLYARYFTGMDIAVLKTCHNYRTPTLIVSSKSDQYIRNMRHDSGYETDFEDYQSRFTLSFVQAEEKAREKLFTETTLDVEDSLERAGLRLERIYFVSRSAMLKVTRGETAGAAIDEHDFRRDIFNILEGIWAFVVGFFIAKVEHTSFHVPNSYLVRPFEKFSRIERWLPFEFQK